MTCSATACAFTPVALAFQCPRVFHFDNRGTFIESFVSRFWIYKIEIFGVGKVSLPIDGDKAGRQSIALRIQQPLLGCHSVSIIISSLQFPSPFKWIGRAVLQHIGAGMAVSKAPTLSLFFGPEAK